MSTFAELLVSLLIVVGATFALIGSWGMVKLPNLITRLHAPTKATTLGVGGALLASMVYFSVQRGAPSVHELLISLFLFLSAPVTANFLAKAYLHRHLDPARDLPPTGRPQGWSTYDELAAEPGAPAAEDDPSGRAPPSSLEDNRAP